MKKVYRDRALKRLYADLQSDDFDLREYAMFELALMLRRANRDGSSPSATDLYSESLPRDLLRIRLSPVVQRKIVDHLSHLIVQRAESRATAFWVLGEVPAEIGFVPTLSAIQAISEQLTDEAAHQACLALRQWMESDELEPESARQELVTYDLSPHLERWSATTDDRLANSAVAVIEALHALAD